MKYFVKGTRAVLNLALALHRKAVLATVSKAYFEAEVAARHVVDQKKYVQLAKERELDLVEVAATAKQSAKSIEVVAKYELARLPSKLA